MIGCMRRHCLTPGWSRDWRDCRDKRRELRNCGGVVAPDNQEFALLNEDLR